MPKMNRVSLWKILVVSVALFGPAACSSDNDSRPAAIPATKATAVAGKPRPAAVPTSPGKITAPIEFEYSIVGNPIVGQQVRVNLQVSSPLNDRTITMHYRVNELGSLTFPESQLQRVTVQPLADATLRSQQITVVPQREGRLYLVVSAEIEAESGTMMRSMSIPIQVGSAPRDTTDVGELVEGTDGEMGISMPAIEP